MTERGTQLHFRGTRLLLIFAALVVVIAGLGAAKDFLVPLALAMFLTVLCVRPMRWLMERRVPPWLACVLVIVGAALVVTAIVVVIGGTLQRFNDELPYYRARIDGIVEGSLSYLASRGIDLSADVLSARFNTSALLSLAGTTVSSVLAAVSNLVIIFLLAAFALLEVSGLPGKLRAALADPQADLTDLAVAADKVQRYLAIKTFLSLLNAVIAIAICVALGVEFPLLWGLLAFLLNYVPNIGSILASVPPVLLALVQHGPARAALVAALYFALDFASGYLLEPRLMGKRLGLSPLVVMISLVFWGFLWGPVGVLLSVPLTSILKIVLEHTRDLAWLAVLLGPPDIDEAPANPGQTPADTDQTPPDAGQTPPDAEQTPAKTGGAPSDLPPATPQQ